MGLPAVLPCSWRARIAASGSRTPPADYRATSPRMSRNVVAHHTMHRRRLTRVSLTGPGMRVLLNAGGGAASSPPQSSASQVFVARFAYGTRAHPPRIRSTRGPRLRRRQVGRSRGDRSVGRVVRCGGGRSVDCDGARSSPSAFSQCMSAGRGARSRLESATMVAKQRSGSRVCGGRGRRVRWSRARRPSQSGGVYGSCGNMATTALDRRREQCGRAAWRARSIGNGRRRRRRTYARHGRRAAGLRAPKVPPSASPSAPSQPVYRPSSARPPTVPKSPADKNRARVFLLPSPDPHPPLRKY